MLIEVEVAVDLLRSAPFIGDWRFAETNGKKLARVVNLCDERVVIMF